jgi:hypothetical protein
MSVLVIASHDLLLTLDKQIGNKVSQALEEDTETEHGKLFRHDKLEIFARQMELLGFRGIRGIPRADNDRRA